MRAWASSNRRARSDIPRRYGIGPVGALRARRDKLAPMPILSSSSRRWLLGLAGAAALASAPAGADDVTVRARALHRAAIVVDTHLDAPEELAEKWADVGVRGATSHFDLPRAAEGGLTAPF